MTDRDFSDGCRWAGPLTFTYTSTDIVGSVAEKDAMLGRCEGH
jgi:hypothetical protein